MRTISKDTYEEIKCGTIFCGICGIKIPIETQNFLMAYQLENKKTKDHTVVLEYMCPACGFITNIRYDTKESAEKFLDGLGLYHPDKHNINKKIK